MLTMLDHYRLPLGRRRVAETLSSSISCRPEYTSYLFMIMQDQLEKAITEWREVFLMGATVHFVGITIYGIFASGDLQPWADFGSEELPPISLEHETTFVSTTLKSCLIHQLVGGWFITGSRQDA